MASILAHKGMQDMQLYMDAALRYKMSNIPNILLLYRLHESNESARQVAMHWHQRNECYAKMQRDAIAKAGFILNEQEYNVINSMLAADMHGSYAYGDIRELYEVLKKWLNKVKK